jgi:hypothetical protein
MMKAIKYGLMTGIVKKYNFQVNILNRKLKFFRVVDKYHSFLFFDK